jgi:hypothetical protein
VEFSTVTDLRPNIEVLEEISRLDVEKQYKSFFNFEKDQKEFSSLEQIRYLNNTFREEILSFIKTQKN